MGPEVVTDKAEEEYPQISFGSISFVPRKLFFELYRQNRVGRVCSYSSREDQGDRYTSKEHTCCVYIESHVLPLFVELEDDYSHDGADPSKRVPNKKPFALGFVFIL